MPQPMMNDHASILSGKGTRSLPGDHRLTATVRGPCVIHVSMETGPVPRGCHGPARGGHGPPGRNHHRVGNGQIAELANDWDGYSGIMPKSSATVAEVLRHYGYKTGAWGKWHNTPAEQTTAAGPFDYWPTGYGFEYFYGFLAGEASQYEPNLVRNTTIVHPSKTPEQGYHLSADLADDAI